MALYLDQKQAEQKNDPWQFFESLTTINAAENETIRHNTTKSPNGSQTNMSEHSEASNYTWLKYLCDLHLGRELAVKNSSGFVGVAVLFCMKQHKSSCERFAKF